MKLFLDKGEIQQGIEQIAGIINSSDTKPDVIICTLSGSVMFFSDLIKRLDFDFLVEFVKPYRNNLVTINYVNVTDKRILIVEDILDTGETLKQIIAFLQQQKCAKINCVSLLRRSSLDLDQFKEQGIGIGYYKTVPESGWVAGYGLDDHSGHKRNLENIYLI